MANELSMLSPDEMFLMSEVRKVKSVGWGELIVKVHAGFVEVVKITETHKRVSGLRVQLMD